MDKIVVIGSSGTGKTTLTNRLAEKFNARAIDLDDLYWRPGWQPAPVDEFRDAVRRAIDAPRWVAAGNYTAIRDITWNQADTLVWLDYSLTRTFNQLAQRSLRRIWDKAPICNGNTETLAKAFSTDGIVFWLLATYHKRKRENEEIFSHPERYPNIRHFVRLKNPGETQAFLAAALPG